MKETKEYTLTLCKKCYQFTNHLKGVCQKCKQNECSIIGHCHNGDCAEQETCPHGAKENKCPVIDCGNYTQEEWEEKHCPNCNLDFKGVGVDSICPECETKFVVKQETKECKHKKALRKNNIDFPLDYICRVCFPSQRIKETWEEEWLANLFYLIGCPKDKAKWAMILTLIEQKVRYKLTQTLQARDTELVEKIKKEAFKDYDANEYVNVNNIISIIEEKGI